MAALAAYRNLFRAARITFQGDEPILNAALSQIRLGFRQNASLEASSPEAVENIKHAEDVAAILKQNVVQGRKDGERYKLRIHEYTERGDNDSIKLAGQKTTIDGQAMKPMKQAGSKTGTQCCSA